MCIACCALTAACALSAPPVDVESGGLPLYRSKKSRLPRGLHIWVSVSCRHGPCATAQQRLEVRACWSQSPEGHLEIWLKTGSRGARARGVDWCPAAAGGRELETPGPRAVGVSRNSCSMHAAGRQPLLHHAGPAGAVAHGTHPHPSCAVKHSCCQPPSGGCV